MSENARILRQITQRLSLRTPQEESLHILADVLDKLDWSRDIDLEKALADIKAAYPTVRDFERDFPSLCFALATGVGKTRLMGAFISYLFLTERSKHFFVLAPNTTIYDKLIQDFSQGTPKYVFRGIAQFAQNPPVIVTGDTWDQGRGVRGSDLFNTPIINIFNVDKINKDKGKVKRLHEYIGQSYFDYLAELPDLVLLMDEAHRYRAKAGMKAVAELKPVLGLELTATPKTVGARSEPFRNVIYDYGLGNAMADGYVKEPAVATRTDFDPKSVTEDQLEQIKLEDGIHYHEHVKVELEIYARQSGRKPVHPFMLVVAQDTAHAKALRERIESDGFFGGRYKGKVAEVHSALKGDENDEAMQRLVALETEDQTEIVIHVNKLKEGWDVTNLYTIVPLRASASDILTEQTLGRGLRLPYGERTGKEVVDTLTVIAHDRFDDIIRKAKEADSLVRVKEIRIGSGGDVSDKGAQVLATPSKLETMLTGQGATANGEGFGEKSAAPFVFDKKDEQEVARTTLDVLRQLERRTPGGLKQLGSDRTRKDIVAIVKETLKPAQGELAGVLDRVNEEDVVSKVIDTFIEQTIEIPEIVVIPTRDVSFGYHDFDLENVSRINYQPIANELDIRELRTEARRRLALDQQGRREERPENYIVGQLILMDEIDYDSQADLLFKLSGQVVDHLRTYLNEEDDIDNVCLAHGQEIARFIFEQMKEHSWETPTDYRATVSRGFQVLRAQQANVPPGYQVRDHREPVTPLSETRKHVFGKFKKCCYLHQKFDSDDERQFAALVDSEHEKDVLRWLKPSAKQFQIEYLHSEQYEPDFVVETRTEKLIVEVKARRDLDDPTVKAKAKAARQWIAYANEHAKEHDGKPWRYVLIPHDKISENSTLAGLVASFALSGEQAT